MAKTRIILGRYSASYDDNIRAQKTAMMVELHQRELDKIVACEFSLEKRGSDYVLFADISWPDDVGNKDGLSIERRLGMIEKKLG